MKALVYAGPHKAVVRDVPDPASRDRTERAKLLYCGLCKTDIDIFAGRHPRAKALSNVWATKGIGGSAFAPGCVAPDMSAALLADKGCNAEITARIPAKPWGNREDMKRPMVLLASSASDYAHGVTLPVNGGHLGR